MVGVLEQRSDGAAEVEVSAPSRGRVGGEGGGHVVFLS